MDSGTYFEPVERALRQEFIPALLGLPKEDILGRFRELLSQSVKKGGLGIRNPVDSADHVHTTSTDAATHLVCTMLDREREFDYECHNGVVADICKDARKRRLERDDAYLEHWSEGNPAEQRRMERAGKAGAYLTAVPNRENGTVLSADEFQDNTRLRYNKLPLDLPQHCDGCGAKLTVKHALSCRVGSLVHIRHDDMADEFRALYTQAFSSGHVQR